VRPGERERLIVTEVAVTVICGDALTLLPALGTDSVDAVVTDPPWNLGREYGSHDDNMPAAEYVAWLNAAMRQCARVSRGPVVACIGGHNASRTDALLEGTGLTAAHSLSWHREAAHEETVLVAAPDGWRAAGRELSAARRSLQSPGPPPRRWDHPCPKPVAMMSALVRLTCPPGGVVLDPFAGTGSTLVAARHTGRHAVGVDLEWRFCRTAAVRTTTP
jgi:DNA modification methylase